MEVLDCFSGGENACAYRYKILETISVGLQSPRSLSMDLCDARLRTFNFKKDKILRNKLNQSEISVHRKLQHFSLKN